jgi:ABC-type multidrug transport system ATPase subunit
MSAATTTSAGRVIIDPGTEPVLVGRAPGMDVLLPQPGVAAYHAAVFRTLAGLQVLDHSGGNTWVNDQPVREAILSEGDRVAFGPVGFVVEYGRLCGVQAGGGITITVADLTVVDGRAKRRRTPDRQRRELLDGVGLTIRSGEFVGLLGPSGAGKTTLLRCLVGYLVPARGTIQADDLALPDQAAAYWPQVGYVPQEDVLFHSLTARENLDYALRIRAPEYTRSDRRQMIEARLRQLGLDDKADTLVGKLSGGERKRVSVAIELLTGPRALYLDEPTAGLDPANETRIMRELRQLAESGTTVVCATHILENVKLFHRAVVLFRGRILYDGSPDGLLEAFNASSYPELYEEETLQARSRELYQPADLAGGPEGDPILPASGRPPAAQIRQRSVSLKRLAGQIAVQAARGAWLIRRDWIWAGMLVFQPIFIGALINLSQVSFVRVSTVFMFAAVTAVWLGLNNTARELVRERRHYIRERLLGLSAAGYLLAKILLFSLIGLGQLVILTFILRHNYLSGAQRQMQILEWSWPGVLAALGAAYLTAVLLGLLVSALVKTQEWAVASLPLIILPQLLLTAEAADMHTPQGRFHSVAYLVNRTGQAPRHAREWAVEGASLLTFTRPCVALLKPLPVLDVPPPPAPQPPADFEVWLTDVGHQAALIVLMFAALLLVFDIRERSWLRSLN